jgi:superfamily II DNA or RNA helicase
MVAPSREPNMDRAYQDFLGSKRPKAIASGISIVPELHHALAPHQRDAVAFGLRQGRWALFFDTGLGKTICELEWCKHAAASTNGRALILAPLAVASQIARTEGPKWGYAINVIRDADDVKDGINVCNYDRLDRINPDDFGAVALDESSILKSFTGKTTRALIDAFSSHRFRMAATATPAPNDHMELGNHAEFLGLMSGSEMLSRWFINQTDTASQKWRLKGHARDAFWDWVASWAVMAETPADMGYDASAYILPPLRIHRHKAAGDIRAPAGVLFASDASATTMHDVKRQTAGARAEMAASIVPIGEPCVIWCDTDYEADALLSRLPNALDVRGSHSAEKKEGALAAFEAGADRVIVTKPSVAGFGLNWQHCASMIFVGRSFSYEAWYQAVRRCWRFGQKKPVDCHLIVAEGEDQIGRVIARKSADHSAMKEAMRSAMIRAASRSSEARVPYNPQHNGRMPSWLSV